MLISQAVEVFFIDRKVRNLSINTLKWYNIMLKKFSMYCEAEGFKNISNVKKYHIEIFLDSMHGKVSDITIKDYFMTMRVFFTFFMEEEYIEKNP